MSFHSNLLKLCKLKVLYFVSYLVEIDIVSRESKPPNYDFYQNDFLSTRKYQTNGTHSVKFS